MNEAELAAIGFNHTVKVGTDVYAYPGTREVPPLETKTRTPAWAMGGHTAVVSVEGYPGGIALSHIDLMPS